MKVYCDRCRVYVPDSELDTHPHNLRIRIIPDDSPLAKDSDVLPLHERARIKWLGERKDPS